MEREPCVPKCEFMDFDEEGHFYCKFYDSILKINYEQGHKIVVNRCEDCSKEGLIGKNSVKESVRKLKQELSWMMDNFYSMKDGIEEGATNIYRQLKELEKEEK